ncbi:MAG: tyrosine-type recombinase/integrase [Acidobacteriota bacterium]
MSALLSDNPEAALASLRPPPHYGSHVGPALRDHVERMRTLGYRCHEGCFLRFDRFVQLRPGAATEPLPALMRAYTANSCSPAIQYEHFKVGRILARALHRLDPSTPGPPAHDRVLKQAMLRQRRRPHIYSADEIGHVLRIARTFPSPHAPLRPQTLHTMILLAYCSGLRMGEIVRLQLRDFRLDEGTLEIRETKFFKSRRLPLKPSVVTALKEYLAQRAEAGLPQKRDGPLFCHEKGGYAYMTAEMLLRGVIQAAGLKPQPGRHGPRIHDFRHTFVVHRMLAWYEQGINPQSRLPYLSTYLGHRDIHSTLVYLTITQELLGLASERYRNLAVSALTAEGEGHDAVSRKPVARVLP